MRTAGILLVFLALFGCSTPPPGSLGLAGITGDVSRAVTWENRTGAPGNGGRSASKLGVGRKGSPRLPLKKDAQVTLMDVAGPGVIRHIWATLGGRKSPLIMRNLILRMYWDDCPVPSVEVPWGDFFACPHGEVVQVDSAMVHTGHEPGRSFNCYFPMPFSRRARITLTNESGLDGGSFYYQVDYDLLGRLPAGAGRFHALFRRQNPTVMKQDYELLRTDQGPGHIAGIVMGIRATDTNWWGEGEVKCYMDGDREWPTICGTGLEDYYLTAFGMGEFMTPHAGCPLLDKSGPGGNPVVSLYRWHLLDPIRWRRSIRLTVQQIGWRKGKGLYERSDDYSTVVYYYLPAPDMSRPPLPDKAARSAGLRKLEKGG